MGSNLRQVNRIFLPLVCLLATALTAQAGVIVVNYGKYPSAREAALDEKNVNWTDADLTDDTICTASFAATELQHYLRRMTDRPEDFTVIKPEALASTAGQTVICLATLRKFSNLPP